MDTPFPRKLHAGWRATRAGSRSATTEWAQLWARPWTPADGSVLNVGRKTRTIPPALRRALDARDRGCRFQDVGSDSQTPTTSCTGRMAEKPSCRIRFSCVAGIIGGSMRAATRSVATGPGGARSLGRGGDGQAGKWTNRKRRLPEGRPCRWHQLPAATGRARSYELI